MARRRRAAAEREAATAAPRTRAARARRQPERGVPVGRTLLVVGGLVALLLVGAALMTSAGAASYSCARVLPVPSGSIGPDGVVAQDLGGLHVSPGTTIEYPSCPPASGPHYSAAGAGPIRPGFYGPDDNAPPGGWVHNLEHGFAVVLYRGGERGPDEATLAQLREFAETGPETESAGRCGYRSKVLVGRFDDMPTPFAVLAWNRWLPLEAWDESAARAFAERWIDTTAPEPNAC